MMGRRCSGIKAGGLPCGAAPLRDGPYCLFHDPGHAEEVRAGRRLGGVRRKRESTIAAAFDLDEVVTYAGLCRLLSIAAFDLLQLDNGIAKARAIIALVSAGARLLDRDHEERLSAVERRVGLWSPPARPTGSVLDQDPR
jgi:hypothetical protein